MLNERAVELGRLIGQSSEYQTVKRANDLLTADKDAMALLEKMERLRQEAQKMIEAGQNPTPEMEQALDGLLGTVQTNATYQRVLVANENFDKVMMQVNQWILDGIKKGATSSIITRITQVTAGRLIVFEGVEGAGKSTQVARLGRRLTAAGVPTATFREPGGTPLGDEIRRLLLDPASTMSARAEALLFMASRAELMAREVRPALAAGTVVLLDRFFLSTYAYQVGARGLPMADVQAANAVATDGLVPDLTLLLTLPAHIGIARATQRSGRDRMEQSGDSFHLRVEQSLAEFATAPWQAAHPECGPIVAIDGAGSEDEVATRVIDALSARIPALDSLRAASGLAV